MNSQLLKQFQNFADLSRLTTQTAAMDTLKRQAEEMYDQQQHRYVCAVCEKKYKTTSGLQRHLSNTHQWNIMPLQEEIAPQTDHVGIYCSSFMKCALLLRDTTDAYQMGDGDRILRNSKLQMLLSRFGNHTKYQLWLFRFMAYCYALLTPRMAYEFLWNCTANLHGNTDHYITNDNLVQILVQAVKKKIYAQGANTTYRSARQAALSLQVQQEIMPNLQNEVDKKQSGQRRQTPSKHNDIVAMVKELTSANIYDNIPGREFAQFAGFKDVFSRVKVTELHKWISDNKERLSFESI